MRVYNLRLRWRQVALTDLLAILTRDAFHRRLQILSSIAVGLDTFRKYVGGEYDP